MRVVVFLIRYMLVVMFSCLGCMLWVLIGLVLVGELSSMLVFGFR